jgi:hypothetical protein
LKVAAKQTCAGEGVIDSIKNPSWQWTHFEHFVDNMRLTDL